MKTITISTVILMLLCLSLCFVTGCRQELVDCRQGNEQLRQTIDEQKTTIKEQKAEIERLQLAEQNYGAILVGVVAEMEEAKKELAKAKQEIKKLKKAALRQKENQKADDKGSKSNSTP